MAVRQYKQCNYAHNAKMILQPNDGALTFTWKFFKKRGTTVL